MRVPGHLNTILVTPNWVDDVECTNGFGLIWTKNKIASLFSRPIQSLSMSIIYSYINKAWHENMSHYIYERDVIGNENISSMTISLFPFNISVLLRYVRLLFSFWSNISVVLLFCLGQVTRTRKMISFLKMQCTSLAHAQPANNQTERVEIHAHKFQSFCVFTSIVCIILMDVYLILIPNKMPVNERGQWRWHIAHSYIISQVVLYAHTKRNGVWYNECKPYNILLAYLCGI